MRLRCLEWPIGPYSGLIEMAAAIEGNRATRDIRKTAAHEA
jgi:hypothetical protein